MPYSVAVAFLESAVGKIHKSIDSKLFYVETDSITFVVLIWIPLYVN